jgi:putative DNA primase/helicase
MLSPKGQRLRGRNLDDVAAAGDEVRPPAFSDETLALRFADEHCGQLRYVAVWGKWLIWEDGFWRSD